jgi:hypothetical protein
MYSVCVIVRVMCAKYVKDQHKTWTVLKPLKWAWWFRSGPDGCETGVAVMQLVHGFTLTVLQLHVHVVKIVTDSYKAGSNGFTTCTVHKPDIPCTCSLAEACKTVLHVHAFVFYTY